MQKIDTQKSAVAKEQKQEQDQVKDKKQSEKNLGEQKIKAKKQKEKKKREKTILGVPVNFNLGKKIKEIEMDTSKYRISNLVFLITLNVLLVAVMIYFLTIVYNAMIFTLAVFTVVVCIIWSVATYLFDVIKIRYIIYEFGIVKNFDSSKNIGEFSKLIGYKKRKSLIDMLGKKKTSTLVLKFNNKWCSRISLPCISENVEDIIFIITTLSNLSDRQPQKRHKEKTIKEKLKRDFIDEAPAQSKISQEKEKANNSKSSNTKSTDTDKSNNIDKSANNKSTKSTESNVNKKSSNSKKTNLNDKK